MNLKAIDQLFQDNFNLICPLCKNHYNETNNFPMLICTNQHFCCEKCLHQKVFKNIYLSLEISQCPVCYERVKRIQIRRMIIFENILRFKNGLDQTLNQNKIEEQEKEESNLKYDEDKDQSDQIKNLQNWLLNEAQVYFFEGKFQNAIIICRNIIQNNPKGDFNFIGLGSKEDFIGYEEEYIKQSYKSHIKLIDNRSPYDLLSLSLLLSSEYEEDKQWFDQQLRLNQQNYQLYFALGLLEANFGHSEEAIEAFSSAVNLNNEFEKAEQCIAFEYYAQGKHAIARQYAEQSLSKNANNIYSLYIHALTIEDQQQKIKKLKNLHKKSPQYLVPLHELGQIYFIQEETEQAIACFKGCLQKSQYYDQARISLGLSYLQDNQPEKAVEIFENNSMANDNQQVIEIMAEAYCGIGLIQEAHKMIKRCKQINPQNKKINYTLANVYEHAQEYDLAIDIYKQLLKEDPQNSEVFKYIAMAFLKKGDYYNAEEWNEQLIKMEPQNTEIMIQIANSYFQQKQMEPALELYLRCFEINQQLALFASKIIKIYTLKHFYEEALHWAKKWNDIEPENPDSWEAISSVSKTIGERIRSKQWQPKKRRNL